MNRAELAEREGLARALTARPCKGEGSLDERERAIGVAARSRDRARDAMSVHPKPASFEPGRIGEQLCRHHRFVGEALSVEVARRGAQRRCFQDGDAPGDDALIGVVGSNIRVELRHAFELTGMDGKSRQRERRAHPMPRLSVSMLPDGMDVRSETREIVRDLPADNQRVSERRDAPHGGFGVAAPQRRPRVRVELGDTLAREVTNGLAQPQARSFSFFVEVKQ